MKHLGQFAVSFLLISSFTYLIVKPLMKLGPSWNGSLEKNDEMRGHMIEMEMLTLDPKSF
jgi:hypothetical protein